MLTPDVELFSVCSIEYWVGIQSGRCPFSVGTTTHTASMNGIAGILSGICSIDYHMSYE
ncbi:hypothetical protein ACT7C8_25215 [Bacillus cereus]|uniref:hypothetical protein n=1 Tax=Bacillus cereus group sp. BfR-BA-01489 TaxID=2920358 RepID=UPI001F570074